MFISDEKDEMRALALCSKFYLAFLLSFIVKGINSDEESSKILVCDDGVVSDRHVFSLFPVIHLWSLPNSDVAVGL